MTNAHIKCFLKRVALINPLSLHKVPTWDLYLVATALTFRTYGYYFLKDLKLQDSPPYSHITSLYRVSELNALSVEPKLCVFQSDSVFLKTDPTFLPKVN